MRFARLSDLQPARRARVGGERRHPRGVAHDPDLPPPRQRLALEELGGVKQLLAAAEPQHPGLIQQSVDGSVAAQRRRRVRARFAEQLLGPSTPLDREDWLAARHAPRDPGKALRAAERLDVQDHRGRPLVLLPALEHVVGGDVGAVAERSEHRDAQPTGGRVTEQPDPDRA